jgi:hypothetical protein
MTDMAAADLRLQLDAMRAARAEDAKACARLTARVKELEAEVASLAHARDYWVAKAGELAEATMAAHGMLAEGTRDETAARCAGCEVPVDDADHLTRGHCGVCAGGAR